MLSVILRFGGISVVLLCHDIRELLRLRAFAPVVERLCLKNLA